MGSGFPRKSCLLLLQLNVWRLSHATELAVGAGPEGVHHHKNGKQHEDAASKNHHLSRHRRELMRRAHVGGSQQMRFPSGASAISAEGVATFASNGDPFFSESPGALGHDASFDKGFDDEVADLIHGGGALAQHLLLPEAGGAPAIKAMEAEFLRGDFSSVLGGDAVLGEDLLTSAARTAHQHGGALPHVGKKHPASHGQGKKNSGHGAAAGKSDTRALPKPTAQDSSEHHDAANVAHKSPEQQHAQHHAEQDEHASSAHSQPVEKSPLAALPAAAANTEATAGTPPASKAPPAVVLAADATAGASVGAESAAAKQAVLPVAPAAEQTSQVAHEVPHAKPAAEQEDHSASESPPSRPHKAAPRAGLPPLPALMQLSVAAGGEAGDHGRVLHLIQATAAFVSLLIVGVLAACGRQAWAANGKKAQTGSGVSEQMLERIGEMGEGTTDI